jgi:hypothetical protein
VVENVAVWNAQDRAADSAEPAITGDVASGAWEVRRSVGFDHESCLAAEEVEDKRPERMLSSELGADERSVA